VSYLLKVILLGRFNWRSMRRQETFVDILNLISDDFNGYRVSKAPVHWENVSMQFGQH
jgi:hypothetical protein